VSRSTRVALVGVHGHGAVHLANLRALTEQARCRLVAVADPVPPRAEVIGPEVAVFGDLPTLLAATTVDIVVLCTPIHTHTSLAEAAMRAGADVLLEKPPVATMAEFVQLQQLCAATGRVCQVGFQSLGSAAVGALRTAVAAGVLGEVHSVVAECAWIRPVSYFRRSRWTGHRELDGSPVMDGALTNPFAHAVATALAVDGSVLVEDVRSVEPDLFHANDIDSDDTSVVRIRTRRGTTVTIAATLCAPEETEPTITVRGSRATAVLTYVRDTISIEPVTGRDDPPAGLAGAYGRVDLLANLIAHRDDPTTPLITDLAATGSFTAVLEAIRRAPAPTPIPAEYLTWVGEGDDRRPVVTEVARWIRLATIRGRTFTELGAPWTGRAEVGRDRVLQVGDRDVGRYRTGLDVIDEHSPRPYLHPLRTRDGMTVTDAGPADHPWHLGLGIAVADMQGSNLWGGPTYVRDTGYRPRPDHGRIEPVVVLDFAAAIEQTLRWVDARGSTRLVERRRLAWSRPDDPAADGVWRLDLTTALDAQGDPVALGSPASNGRPGAGYGGLFWRLPPVDALEVRTPIGEGEDAVHGSIAPWLAVLLRAGDRRATLLIVADPESADPWFVRVSEYPGVGAAWAWERAVSVVPGRPLRRSYRFAIADGHRDPHELITLTAPHTGALHG
jgi:predicted dehydrogenase